MVITAYLHLGVVIGLLPTTGLTLPFISYGRSNLLLSMLMTGILVNIGSTRGAVYGERAPTDPLARARARGAHEVLFAGGGTGGHLYPGIAIARALVRAIPAVHPHFVGALRGIERDVLPGSGFPHTLLDLHPLYRPRVWKNWRTLRGAAARGARSGASAARLRARASSSAPAATPSGVALVWAWRTGMPIVQHIGDSHPGITARASARASREAYLGFPEAGGALPHSGVRVHRYTGNPIEPPPDIRPDARCRARAVGLSAERSRAARLRRKPGRARPQPGGGGVDRPRRCPIELCVIWATGTAQYDAFKQYDRADVRVVPYLSPIGDAYAASDLALVRAGMMGTTELCAWEMPMIVCPLPTAAQDHQTTNAVALESAGAAIHLPQRELTAERLDTVVRALLADPDRMRELARSAALRARPHAAADIAGHIEALLRA